MKGTLCCRRGPPSLVQIKRARDAQSYHDQSTPPFLQEKRNKLLNVIYDKSTYYLYQPFDNQTKQELTSDQQIDQNLWLVVRYMEDQKAYLKQNDVVRFGRIQFRIVELETNLAKVERSNTRVKVTPVNQTAEQEFLQNQETMNNNNLRHSMSNASTLTNLFIRNKPKKLKRKAIIASVNVQSGKLCRICLEEEETFESPFIVVCQCIGSVKFIHLMCLRSWTDNKKTVEHNPGITSYQWENLQCEICKTNFQLTVEHEGQVISVLEIQRPAGPYLVLESETQGQCKTIYLLDLSVKKSFSVGRRISNEISLSDISVSREQARLVFYDSVRVVLLYDSHSKFGTFIKVQGLMEIEISEKAKVIPLQIERKCFFLTQEDRFSSWEKCTKGCFFNQEKLENQYDYFENTPDRFPLEIQQVLYPHLSRMIENAQKQIQSKKEKNNQESITIPRLLEAQNSSKNPMNITGIAIDRNSNGDSDSASLWSSNESQIGVQSDRAGSLNDRTDSVNDQVRPDSPFSVDQIQTTPSQSLGALEEETPPLNEPSVADISQKSGQVSKREEEERKDADRAIQAFETTQPLVETQPVVLLS